MTIKSWTWEPSLTQWCFFYMFWIADAQTSAVLLSQPLHSAQTQRLVGMVTEWSCESELDLSMNALPKLRKHRGFSLKVNLWKEKSETKCKQCQKDHRYKIKVSISITCIVIIYYYDGRMLFIRFTYWHTDVQTLDKLREHDALVWHSIIQCYTQCTDTWHKTKLFL